MKTENFKSSTTLKNPFRTLLVVLGLALAFTSCEKEDNINPTEEQPNGQALSDRFIENRQENIQNFVVSGSAGGTIQGVLGTAITIPANSLGLNGQPVTGDIDIKLIEIYNKSDMLLNNLPTNGRKPNSDIEMLKSGGEFFIKATQNGNDLEILSPIQLQSRPIDFADVDSEMKLFNNWCDPTNNDCDDLEEEFVWQEDEFTQVGMGEVQTADGWSSVYLVDLSEFGWTNLDRWYNYDGELTTLNIDVPEGYNGNNCEVYLSYDGEDSGLARMDVFDEQIGMFTEHYGNIPVGLDVHIILVAEINGVLHYAIQGTNITQNHIEIMAVPQAGTQNDLSALIQNLP